LDAILRSPSSVGDLIGYAMRICRQQVLSLIRILLVPSIIELIGKIVLIYGLHILVASGVNKVPVIVQSCSLITVGLIISLAAEFFLTLRQLALVRLYGGFANTYDEAYRFVAAKKFFILAALLGTNSVYGFVFMFWCFELGFSAFFLKTKAVMLIAAGCLVFGIIGLLVSLILVGLPLCVVIPAVACENREFTSVVMNAIKLVYTNIFRTIFFLILLIVCIYGLSTVLNLPPLVVTFIEYAKILMEKHQPAVPQIGFFSQVFASFWRSGTQMLISPMTFIACGFYYLDLRMRQEGFDLKLRLEELSQRVPDLGS
jgi:hypothetical protein